MKRRIVGVIIIICLAASIICGMLFLRKWRLGRELTAAVYMSDIERVTALIKQNPMMNVRFKASGEFISEVSNGWTPLHMAVGRGDYAMIDTLVSNGADVNAQIVDPGFTPLLSNYQFVRNEEISRQARSRITQLLIKYGADPTISDKTGRPPIYVAMERGEREAIDLLYARSIQPNYQDEKGDALLHLAARYGYEKIALDLLARGANPNIVNKENITPIHSVAEHGI